jgi:hypothetical protein
MSKGGELTGNLRTDRALLALVRLLGEIAATTTDGNRPPVSHRSLKTPSRTPATSTSATHETIGAPLLRRSPRGSSSPRVQAVGMYTRRRRASR